MSRIEYSSADVEELRILADKIARIASEDQSGKVKLWTRLNDLDSIRPALRIDEIPWHEMDFNSELTLRCESEFAREIENRMRRLIYQHSHFPGDMVVSSYWPCQLAVHNTSYGIQEDVRIVKTDKANDVVSREFHPIIINPEDIQKIRMAEIRHDIETTEKTFSAMTQIFGYILPVVKQGIQMVWYTPWDELIRWWGVEQAMMDLGLRPEMVNEAVSRCVESMNYALDQMIEQNLLSLGTENIRVGSGGYAYCSGLPGGNYDPSHVMPHNNWGCSNAQIFSSVSPEMHWEFALRHDMAWLKRWGLNYYGCCEPLDGKIEILKRIPNLRKISMSPWINVGRAVKAVSDKYVFSYKPNPAFLAEDNWRPELVRETLREVLDETRGCHVEIILKDISTVRYEPQRLWQWHDICVELLSACYKLSR